MALIIVMVNSISMGSSLAFSTTAAVVYSSANTTTLNEVLDEEQTSWLSNVAPKEFPKEFSKEFPNK